MTDVNERDDMCSYYSQKINNYNDDDDIFISAAAAAVLQDRRQLHAVQ